MITLRSRTFLTASALAAAALISVLSGRASGHCDTLDGPVVADARKALAAGDVTPVLKWVKAADEEEIREAFRQALAVRALGKEAKDLADRHFFETLVRVHRAGEGAPYTGLKSAGTDLGPALEGADRALETGDIEGVVKLVTADVAEGIRKRFHRTLETRKHAEESVEKGREFVEAYVEYVHYVEGLHARATGGGEPEGHEGH